MKVTEFLLLLTAGVRSLSGLRICPDDVHLSTAACLKNYEEQVVAFSLNGDRFFTGVDVEHIRFICSWLDSSVACIKDIRDSCPQEKFEEIEEVVNPHIATLDMCKQTNVYEEYAMNQNCFVRLRRESEACYEAFLKSLDDIREYQRTAANSAEVPTPKTVQAYCRRLEDLIDCVTIGVNRTCNPVASRLTKKLVRTAATHSSWCPSGGPLSPLRSNSYPSVSRTVSRESGRSSKNWNGQRSDKFQYSGSISMLDNSANSSLLGLYQNYKYLVFIFVTRLVTRYFEDLTG